MRALFDALLRFYEFDGRLDDFIQIVRPETQRRFARGLQKILDDPDKPLCFGI